MRNQLNLMIISVKVKWQSLDLNYGNFNCYSENQNDCELNVVFSFYRDIIIVAND